MGAMADIPDRDQIAADEARIGALLRAVEAPAPAGADAGDRSRAALRGARGASRRSR